MSWFVAVEEAGFAGRGWFREVCLNSLPTITAGPMSGLILEPVYRLSLIPFRKTVHPRPQQPVTAPMLVMANFACDALSPKRCRPSHPLSADLTSVASLPAC
ncbi:MAG: hypothetical protein EA381_15760 [Planctomycetaceae bacterium]|nr:MAG: hypothetical protein EA381_15760 [Planctomycetaceae bacterium]